MALSKSGELMRALNLVARSARARFVQAHWIRPSL